MGAYRESAAEVCKKAAAQFRAGDLEAALLLLRKALTIDSTSIEALSGIGLITLTVSNLATAERCFARVLSLDPRQANAHYHLGVIALARDNRKGAHAHFREAIRLDPGHPRARQALVESERTTSQTRGRRAERSSDGR
jgi:Flp pilus assembly protein TadD